MPPESKDLFTPVAPESKLHPSFQIITNQAGSEPARLMMNRVFREFPDKDGNFLQQFQTTGFDARTFELYLFAYLSAGNYAFNNDHTQPDFIVSSREGVTAAIEATTVNPSSGAPTWPYRMPVREVAQDELRQKLDNELPIRLGSPLFSKLNKRYWELDQCKGIPLVFAIEAFHEEGSLFYTDTALGQDLYGLKHFPSWTEDGQLLVHTEDLEHHVHGKKVIPSNFFGQPDAEYISAIIYTNSGTYSKFLRMGYQAGFHRGNLRITRTGHDHDPNPNSAAPLLINYDLDNPPLPETWAQGIMVFHNPNAKYPLPRDFFIDAASSFLDQGRLASDLPPLHPFMSLTGTVVLPDPPSMISSRPMIVTILKRDFAELAAHKSPWVEQIYQEREWFSDSERSVIGTVLLDLIDGDWSFVVLSHDEFGDFRPADFAVSLNSRNKAMRRLLTSMKRVIRELGAG